MSINAGVLEERRVGISHVLQSLLDTRTHMLSAYNLLISQKPFKLNETVQELLQDFCQSLVDYTAIAHFHLYHYLEENRERREGVLEMAEVLYPQIVSNTQCILDFNDVYDCEEYCSDIGSLEKDLSSLGETLAERIALEDKVVDAMLDP